MLLTRDEYDKDFWQSEYEIAWYNYTFEITYDENTKMYTAIIDTEHEYLCNSYREAQGICEWYIQWIVDYRSVLKDVLSQFIED